MLNVNKWVKKAGLTFPVCLITTSPDGLLKTRFRQMNGQMRHLLTRINLDVPVSSKKKTIPSESSTVLVREKHSFDLQNVHSSKTVKNVYVMGRKLLLI